MKIVGIHEAKKHFFGLIKAVEEGEEVIVQRGDQPVARIVACAKPPKQRKPGILKGQIWIADDFDDIPPEFDEYSRSSSSEPGRTHTWPSDSPLKI